MERNYIIEGLFILLGLATVVTIIKYPKEALIKLPLGIAYYVVVRPLRSILIIPIWIIGFPLIYFGEKYNWSIVPTIKNLIDAGTDDDRPHSATKNLSVDFKRGDKYIFVIDSGKNVMELIKDLVGILTENYSVDDFTINTKKDQTIIGFPKNISFYDYHLTVQYFSDELGSKKSFGIYKSDNLQYFVYQDSEAVNNLVGFTSDKRLFSIYLLDDLDAKQDLRLNRKLKVDTEWVERWTSTTANDIFTS